MVEKPLLQLNTPTDNDDAQMDARFKRLEDAITDVRAAITETRVLHGTPVTVFSSEAQNKDSDDAVDCRKWNALYVQVIATGSPPSATISVKGSDNQGGIYNLLPDANANQPGVTANTSFVVVASTPWAKAAISNRTGGNFTVTITPCRLGAGATTTEVQAAQGGVTDRSGTVTTGGTAQQLMAANAARKYLLIQNVSTADLWFNFTTTAVQAQPSLKLSPNSSFVMEGNFVSTDAISIIGATTGQAFAAKEA